MRRHCESFCPKYLPGLAWQAVERPNHLVLLYSARTLRRALTPRRDHERFATESPDLRQEANGSRYVVAGSLLTMLLLMFHSVRVCPTPGSAAPPQNYPLPGQDRLNHQHLLRPKMPQRWRRMHPLLGELVHGRCQPTPNFFYDTVLLTHRILKCPRYATSWTSTKTSC
jgi:hypothetical protein